MAENYKNRKEINDLLVLYDYVNDCKYKRIITIPKDNIIRKKLLYLEYQARRKLKVKLKKVIRQKMLKLQDE